MLLSDYLSPDRVFCKLDCKDKPDLINKLVERLQKSCPSIKKEEAVSNLLEKEGVFSTGVGGGVAIPHAVVSGLEKTVMAVASLENGIDYKSVDNEPVKLVFLLLSPQGRTREHIKLLARIVRLCFERDFVEEMEAASDPRALYDMVTAKDASNPD
jgi:PTS system nitrogen regulatory IIA component